MLAACAVVEPPPGGPIDAIPPHLVAMQPDSGATGLGPLQVMTFAFSEKMDRTAATGWLRLFPEARIRRTSWHGATRAEVEFEQPLPADTVLVVEIAAGMRDAHKMAAKTGRRFPLATGDSLPGGRIAGSLTMADTGLAGGVVELYAVPPDSLQYFAQPILRRAVTDSSGGFALDWLPVPGGPWLVRAFQDQDGNLRLGEKEARRLLPDTLSLTAATPAALLPPTALHAVNDPGALVCSAPPRLPTGTSGARPWAIFMHEAAEDSGWAPGPRGHEAKTFFRLGAAGGDTLAGLAAGPGRLILFLDCDGDSSLGVVPVDLVPADEPAGWLAPVDAAADTFGHYLEPWLLAEGLTVEPGLATSCAPPDTVWTLTPLPGAVAPADSAAAAAPDAGAAAPADSAAAEPQELR